MITKPVEAVKNQTRFQEETIQKSVAFIEGKVSAHLNKYPDDEGLYNINIPMAEHRDFQHFWEEIETIITKKVEEAGWTIVEGQALTNNTVQLKLKLTDESQLEALEAVREQEKKDFHRTESLRRSAGIH